jgi:ABC-type transport system involved in multi-copper enzyme maturation permease subunit
MRTESAVRPSPSTNNQWQRGFGAIFQRELETWWFRKLLISAILWTLLIVGLPLVLVSSITGQAGEISDETSVPGFGFLFLAWTSLPMFGTIFSTQGVISDEDKAGTLSWVMSKPIARSAFYLAKLLPSALIRLVVVVVLQGILASLFITIEGGSVNAIGFLGAMALVGLIVMFYLTLTQMLDTFLPNHRAAVVGIPVAILISGAVLPSVLLFGLNRPDLTEFLLRVTPWGLDSSGLEQLALGQPLPNTGSIICTVIWIVIFVTSGIWRFNCQDV